MQGVGFRPFVYNLAHENDISGFVGNNSSGVYIEAQGREADLNSFLTKIREQPPPLALVEEVSTTKIASISKNGFYIQSSQRGEVLTTYISPDIATCHDCTIEFEDPLNRRYLYPFTNCTNCGPRYSIIYSIPYDRPNTSMEEFQMCKDCLAEYEDPGNRRFHAQPNACEECGPWLILYGSSGKLIQEKEYAVVLTRRYLGRGQIVAIKGLGGYHLACNALSAQAIEQLRVRKNREHKPLALMVRDLTTALKYVDLNDQEKNLLTSTQAPIVLARKKDGVALSGNIAPGNSRLGVMLPYTPLHKLLFRGALEVLVMTSGNIAEEPICIENNDALERLGPLSDYVLTHNRDILQRVDDSVSIVLDGQTRMIRRSRGYVPGPIKLLYDTDPILAVGAELKHTLAVSKNDRAFVSQHIGDLANVRTIDFFHHTRHHLQSILEIKPAIIGYDLHPGYASSQWAKQASHQQEYKTIGIQHHHAHMASCMVENGINDPAIAIVLDGTGYGPDGKIWGGEMLVGNYTAVNRFAHFEYVPMPGGDKAALEPWRMGVSYLYHTFGEEYAQYVPETWQSLPVSHVVKMIRKNINSPLTSSCGRLFDGVAAISGGRTHITYEAHSAIEFQNQLVRGDEVKFEYELEESAGQYKIRLAPLLRSLVDSLDAGYKLPVISCAFHEYLVRVFTELAERARAETGLNQVVLSGGVMQNSYLFERFIERLREHEFSVISQSQVPSNDGGISLGQLAVVQALLREKKQQPIYQNI